LDLYFQNSKYPHPDLKPPCFIRLKKIDFTVFTGLFLGNESVGGGL
jgi:hypothetical protein